MPKLLAETAAGPSVRLTNGRSAMLLLVLFVLAGGLIVLRPWWIIVGLGCAAVLAFCWRVAVQLRRSGLELWQMLVLICLAGYMVLNYGFENLTIHVGGLPLIISYGLMYLSLVLALFARQKWIRKALKDPVMLSMLVLIGVSGLHLLVDLPAYGLWAIRDASICLDGIFFLVGMFWATKLDSAALLCKWLLVIFVLNLIYSFTLPWGEQIWSWSPDSGVFLPVAIFGNFRGSGDVLTAGAMFCICIGDYLVKRPRWLMPFLAMAQLLGIAIAQTRRMYLGLVIMIILLLLLKESKKSINLVLMLGSGIVVLFLATTVGDLKINGRIGPVNLSFFGAHIRSMSGAEDTPGSSVQSRFDWVDEAMEHFHAHPILGEGFGQPLLTDVDDNGAVTRMPHNSSLTILARLGIVGFAIWLVFHLSLIGTFLYALLRKRQGNRQFHDLVLWLFLFYILFMIASFVEAPFEFPSAAVRFYVLMGFAVGLIRWQLPKQCSSTAMPLPATPVATTA